GHMRLADDGPVGFGKAGSFEGFCSGGGIAKLATTLAEHALNSGNAPLFCPTYADLPNITAKNVAEAAHQGDALAGEIFQTVAHRLGQGLAPLVDLLNPQRIIIGSIYLRQRTLLDETMWRVLHEEAMPLALSVCDVVPPALGEQIGDYAALA